VERTDSVSEGGFFDRQFVGKSEDHPIPPGGKRVIFTPYVGPLKSFFIDLSWHDSDVFALGRIGFDIHHLGIYRYSTAND